MPPHRGKTQAVCRGESKGFNLPQSGTAAVANKRAGANMILSYRVVNLAEKLA